MRLLIALLLLAATAHAADVTVRIEGPTEADAGFALVGSADHDAVLRWRIDGPEKAVPPLELLDSQGRPVLVFISPVAGRYKVTLTGQVPTDGLDPWADATHVVVVGKVSPTPPNPEPDPNPPNPTPTPDLTGTAKAVFDAASGVDKSVVRKIAAAYQKQITAIQSGSLNGQPLGTAIGLVMRGLASESPPREQAASLYDVIEKELQARDDAGKLDTLDGVLACLLEINEGLGKAGE